MTAAINHTTAELARLKRRVDELTHRTGPCSWYHRRRTEAARCAPPVRARRSVAQEGRATSLEMTTPGPRRITANPPAAISNNTAPVRVLNADAEPNWKYLNASVWS